MIWTREEENEGIVVLRTIKIDLKKPSPTCLDNKMFLISPSLVMVMLLYILYYATVLKFYGIKSIRVQDWTEDVFEHNPFEQPVILMSTSSDPPSGNAVTSPTTQPPGVVDVNALNGSGQEAVSWADPLGIKSSIFGKAKRRTITPNHCKLLRLPDGFSHWEIRWGG
jgi:hypothetical protein